MFIGQTCDRYSASPTHILHASVCLVSAPRASNTLAALCDLGGAHVSLLLLFPGCEAFDHVTVAF